MIPFAGQVWRILPQGADPRLPATAPEGRFHHSGQDAIYTSLTPEGTVVAIRRYIRADDQPRVIHPITVQLKAVVDLRGQARASVVWQDLRAAGQSVPTWALSDAARGAGAQGLLYSSRSRPDLAHLVVFAAPDQVMTKLGTPLPAAPWMA